MKTEWMSSEAEGAVEALLGAESKGAPDQDLLVCPEGEEALRQSEARFREMVNFLPQIIFEMDAQGNLTFVNQSAVDLLGYSRDELRGKHPLEVIVLEDRNRAAENLMRVLRGEKLTSNEYYILRKNGSSFPAMIHTNLIIHNGVVEGMRGLIVDLSERKRAENRLQKLNECFLNFGSDPVENINRLTALCGTLLDATCALYNRMQEGSLCALGRWNTPDDFVPQDDPTGHICFDVMRAGQENVTIIRNLPQTSYFQSDKNVARYGLMTYMGRAVKLGRDYVGTLCVVYQKDVDPSEDDRNILNLAAAAIAIEEKRRQALSASQESDLRYRHLFERNLAGVYRTTTDGHILDCNDSFARILGYASREEVLASNAVGFYSESSQRDEFINNLKAKGVITNREQHLQRRDGSVVWVLENVSLISDIESGEVLEGTLVDITERKRTEEKLKASEERLRDITFSSADWVWEVNEKGEYTYSSQKGQDLLGYLNEEIIGKSPFDFMPPDEARKIAPIFAEIVAKTAPIKDLENWNIAKNGERICLLTNGVPILDEFGKLIGYRGVDKNITERKREEENLRESELRMRSLFENMLNGFAYCRMIYDAQGEPQDFVYLNVNNAFEAQTGLKNVIGKRVTEIIPGIRQTDPELFELYYQVVQSGVPQKFETYIKALEMWFEVSVYSPATDHFVAVFDVITDRKKAEDALRERETKFRTLFVTSRDAFMTFFPPDWKFTNANPAMVEMFGTKTSRK